MYSAGFNEGICISTKKSAFILKYGNKLCLFLRLYFLSFLARSKSVWQRPQAAGKASKSENSQKNKVCEHFFSKKGFHFPESKTTHTLRFFIEQGYATSVLDCQCPAESSSRVLATPVIVCGIIEPWVHSNCWPGALTPWYQSIEPGCDYLAGQLTESKRIRRDNRGWWKAGGEKTISEEGSILKL